MKKYELPIKSVLSSFVDQYKHRSKLRQSRIETFWKEWMGPMIAGYTEKVVLRGSTLTLYITSSSLKSELNFSKEKIRDKLNNFLGEEIIKQVVIR